VSFRKKIINIIIIVLAGFLAGLKMEQKPKPKTNGGCVVGLKRGEL
jgi:hypothetical protein